MKRIGILGGTFDPPHLGHLIMAEEARISLELEEIWFIPSYEPPHKPKAKIDANERIKMLEKAVEKNAAFKINTIEMERSEKSYSYDTMRILKDEHPEIDFYFIIGADMVEYLPLWNNIDKLIDLITFVGVKRQGFHLKSPYPVKEIEIPMIEISSTFIRERLANNKTVNYLIPESVYAYIKEKKLYENK